MRAALCLLLLAPSAYAGNNEVSIGPATRSLRSDSANAVARDNLGGPQFMYAHRLGLELVPGLELWATAGYAYGLVDGTLFGMDTQADSHLVSVGGRARYRVLSHLAASARVEAGAARTRLAIEGPSERVEDAGWGGVAGVALGGEVLLVARPRFSCGVRLELGYLAATGVALSPAGRRDADMLEIATAQASIGHLDLGGRAFSVAFLAQF